MTKTIKSCKQPLKTKTIKICKEPLNNKTRRAMSQVMSHLHGKNAVRTYHILTRNARAIPNTAPKGLLAIKRQIMKSVPKPKRPHGPRLNWNCRAALKAAVNLNQDMADGRIPANRNRLAQTYQAALFRPKEGKRKRTYANNVEYVCNASRYAPGGINLSLLHNADHFIRATNNNHNGYHTRRNIVNLIT